MKRAIWIPIVLIVALLTACGAQTSATRLDSLSQNEEPVDAGNILIVYFSLGDNYESPAELDAVTSASIQLWEGEVTGNAGIIARTIRSKLGGELFSILTEKKYPGGESEILSVGRAEQIANERPELVSEIEGFDEYDAVFLIYPTWWYKMPMALYNFFDAYDFSGKTLYVVNTSSGSRFVDEINTIKGLEPDATVIEGISLLQGETDDAEEFITEWLDKLNLNVEPNT